MSRLALSILGLVSGCAGIFDLDPIGNAGLIDSGVDAPDGAPSCFGGNSGGFLRHCPIAEDLDAWEVPATVNTDTQCEQALGQLVGPSVCLIIATDITITTPVFVRGGRPLALLATGTLTIGPGGELLANSLTAGPRGANGNPAGVNCNAKPGIGVVSVGGGGGGGGSFGTRGEAGGTGANTSAAAGATGDPVEVPLTSLRGGCPGGGGGNTSSSNGDGGGAVYLIAGTGIILDNAIINASGAGGLRGNARGGAGGGGAGGMIVLDTPALTMISSRLVAHGGGGGGGGGDATAGGDGNHADLTKVGYPAAGGIAAVGGGEGGHGADATAAAGGASGQFGGGGGGGGYGVIRLFTGSPVNTSTIISPPAQ